LPVLQEGLQRSFDQRRAKGSITLPEALDLIWAYLAFDAHRSFGPLVGALAADEDRRRYVEENVVIKTPDRASLAVVLIRPKIAAKRLPALLELTIYESQQSYAKEAAAHGYVGVVAYARGTHGSPDKVVPFEHDGDDARAVIDWIAKQPWSTGRVGMYGSSSYSGFAAWAAAKRLPPALKAIATSDSNAPGIDVPMAGNIFRNSAYRWVFYVTNVDGSAKADEKIFTDDAQWRAYEQAWYTSGKRYREFPSIPGWHSTLFRRWLSHPSYDRYWQKMVPFREQFSRINIPVLTTTGYYAGGEVGALYYFTQHYRYNPRANHTLLIGPYDEGAMQRGPLAVLQGYQVDSAALIDLRELRYQWFDHVLKGGKKPSLLQDRVNYQVMGADEWRHAPSLEGMAQGSLRFYLEAAPSADRNSLTERKSSDAAFLPQTFDLADRSDANWTPPSTIVSKGLQPHNGEIFVSEPLQQPLELSGLFSGRLDFTVNRMDMDLNIALYELLPNGDYLQLFDPSYEIRASYVGDPVKRHLLKAGVHQQLTFRSERMTSRKLQAGSRVVMVLGINKRPDRQINYGTGDDVSEESIDDGRIPLKIRWYGSSYIDLPIRR
jgi:putative CocE/NonD family hydrolase